MKKSKTYSVSEFKAKSLSIFEEIARSGNVVLVTKRGKPIAQVIPLHAAGDKPVPGRLSDTLVEEVDVITPFGAKLWKAAEPK